MKRASYNEQTEIYFQEKIEFAFTPFYYDPTTCRGVVGPRENIDPVNVVMAKEFNKELLRPNSPYKKIKVPQSSFEELHEAASRRDRKAVEKIIEEKFH